MGPLVDAILSSRDVRARLAEGHSPNVYEDFPGVSWTPLHLAVYHRIPQAVQALLQGGARPNAEALPCGKGPFQMFVGFKPVDVAVAVDSEDILQMLVQAGGIPGQRGDRAHPKLRTELEKARAVGVAQGWVAESLLLPLVEHAQQNEQWDEADRLLRLILSHENEGEGTYHRRIRGFLARGLKDEALEEASLVFLDYRRQGRYWEALQVVRCMRAIDPDSSRPYEMEMEFLADLGSLEEARGCLQRLQELHRHHGRLHELKVSEARFNLLCRRPRTRAASRLPSAWRVPNRLVAPTGNLPAVWEERVPWWRRLWGNR